MDYLAWKLIHIASVIIFLGNIITGLFWAAHASRTRDPRLISSAFEGIIRSDRLFTMPGVFGIIISGVAAALTTKLPLLSTGWILWPMILFAISGVIFSVWLVPLQRKIFQMAGEADASDPFFERYSRLYRKWELWGFAALAAPLAAFVIMVLKPALPGL